MPAIPDALQLLFETSLEDDGDRYVVPIPKELVENGSLSVNGSYRIALMAAANAPTQTETDISPTKESPRDVTETDTAGPSEASNTSRRSTDRRTQGPPVEEGDIRSVTIDTLGDQGDGIAKVERGFIVIIPGTQPGDQVEVEIMDVKENVAFAEPVSDIAVR